MRDSRRRTSACSSRTCVGRGVHAGGACERQKRAINSASTRSVFVRESRLAAKAFVAAGLTTLTYDELMQRDKVSLDIFWLKDDSLEDSANLPAPEILAQEITENLQAALEQFNSIYEALEAR